MELQKCTCHNISNCVTSRVYRRIPPQDDLEDEIRTLCFPCRDRAAWKRWHQDSAADYVAKVKRDLGLEVWRESQSHKHKISTKCQQISNVTWTFVAGNGSGFVCFESDAAGCLLGIDQINDIFQSISLALSLSLSPSLPVHVCKIDFIYVYCILLPKKYAACLHMKRHML